jgi:hypothetical protein
MIICVVLKKEIIAVDMIHIRCRPISRTNLSRKIGPYNAELENGNGEAEGGAGQPENGDGC